MKNAHITSRPHYEVGERVLGLCGKEFKVKIEWSDIPSDHPVCRNCIDTAIRAMTQADTLLVTIRRRLDLVVRMVGALAEAVVEDDLLLDNFADRDQEHQEQQREKREAKAERKRSKHTCTCTWTSSELRVADPDCPIHKDEEEEVMTEEAAGE